MWRTINAGAAPRRAALGCVFGAVTLAAVSACGGAAATSTTAGGGAPATPTSQPTGAQVTVTMTDYRLALDRQAFPPGAYTFVATNAGHATHALEIVGPGVQGQRTGTVQPGQSASVTVTLQPGRYELYCPIDGHRSMGMDTTISVSGAAAPTGGGQPSTAGGGGGGYGY
jgi:plastocyanin